MPLEQIQNGDTGLEARTKINAAIVVADGLSGSVAAAEDAADRAEAALAAVNDLGAPSDGTVTDAKLATGSGVKAITDGAAAASNGLLAKTGAGTFAGRTLAEGAGIVITHGDGVSGNPTIAADVGTGADQIVQLDGSARLPAVDGSQLTNIQQWTTGSSTATTSGTQFDVTSIPATAREIEILFNDVGLDASGDLLVQIGTGSGIETTGYVSSGNVLVGGSGSGVTSTAGFIVNVSVASRSMSGLMRLAKGAGNDWYQSHNGATVGALFGGGAKTLSGVLTQLRLTRTGSGAFDAGSFTVRYR